MGYQRIGIDFQDRHHDPECRFQVVWRDIAVLRFARNQLGSHAHGTALNVGYPQLREGGG